MNGKSVNMSTSLAPLLVILATFVVTASFADAPASAPAAKPTSATLVNKPPDVTDWEVGDIQVTFADGKTELFTHDQKCGRPHVSASGDVGWSVWNDSTPDGAHHTGETLRVRLHDGKTKDFKPNRSRFIMDWNFVDHDSAVVIASMGYHGPTSFIVRHRR